MHELKNFTVRICHVLGGLDEAQRDAAKAMLVKMGFPGKGKGWTLAGLTDDQLATLRKGLK